MTNNNLHSRLKRLSQAGAWCVLGMGAAVLAGSWFHIHLLTTPVAGTVSIKANTALCFFLSAHSLLIFHRRAPRVFWTWVGMGEAALVMLIGLMILLEHLLRIDLRIDQLLVRESLAASDVFFPGRMSPSAAACFFMSGLAEILLHRRRLPFLIDGLLISVLVMAGLPLLGYAFGVEALYGLAGATHIAIGSAAGLMVLSLAAGAASPADGLSARAVSSGIAGSLFRQLLPIMLGVPPVLGWLFLEGSRHHILSGATALALFSAMTALVLATLVATVTARLESVDGKRAAAETALRDERDQLEGRIRERTGELRQSEEGFRTFFDGAPVGLCMTAPDGRLLRVNPAFRAMLGYSAEELENSAYPSITYPEDIARSQECVRILLAGPQDFITWEKRYIKHDGGALWTQVTTRLLRDVDQKPLRFLTLIQDISERKTAEANREKMLGLVQQAKKMEAVGTLAAGVAHEINNPLGVILGYAEAVLRRLGAEDHALAEPLRSIEREAIRCKNLVQDLLSFSRSSRHAFVPLDLSMAVEGALSLVQAQAGIRRSSVQKNLKEGLPLFLGNQTQIQQIVINLAQNAMDAMANGGVVTIRTELLHDSPRDWVCLRVSDQGSGIPPNVLPRIFEPFFTTKSVDRGTGLGLSLVFDIVNKHAGVIDVTSRPGLTEFCVKFPVQTNPDSKSGLELAGDGRHL